MNDGYDISQISAEFLLNYLYPECNDKWIAHYEGTFFRNYNNDQMTVYENNNEVVLARDSYLKLLPEALISDESELREVSPKQRVASFEKMEQRVKVLRDAFLPIDTFNFRKKLQVERQTSELLEKKINIILESVFHYDIDAETNKYVKEIAPLLPFVSKIRADFDSIARLLGTMMGCKTRLVTGRYSHIDSTQCWIPSVEYQLIIPNLTAQEYRSLIVEIGPLQHFIAEWMMPAEVRCEITVKHHSQSPKAGEDLVLDYNFEI